MRGNRRKERCTKFLALKETPLEDAELWDRGRRQLRDTLSYVFFRLSFTAGRLGESGECTDDGWKRDFAVERVIARSADSGVC